MKISRHIIQDNLSPRDFATCVGIVGGGRSLSDVLECLYGKKAKISKSEKQKWVASLDRLESYPLAVASKAYVNLNISSVRVIMNSGKRYRLNMLAFYAFILSKAIYNTHITQISYDRIIKEFKIERHNITKYIKDLEDLKVLKCFRNAEKNRNNCNIYVPYEFREEVENCGLVFT